MLNHGGWGGGGGKLGGIVHPRPGLENDPSHEKWYTARPYFSADALHALRVQKVWVLFWNRDEPPVSDVYLCVAWVRGCGSQAQMSVRVNNQLYAWLKGLW